MASVKNALLSEQTIWNAIFDSTNSVLRIHSGSGDGSVAARSVQEIANKVYDSANKRLKTR